MKRWYSSKVRLVCLVEASGAVRYMDSVYIFQANSFGEAHHRALTLGLTQEEEYINIERKRVKWRLKELISLDLIQAEDLDGVEVYSEPAEIEEGSRISFETEFEPEKSEPTQTI